MIGTKTTRGSDPLLALLLIAMLVGAASTLTWYLRAGRATPTQAGNAGVGRLASAAEISPHDTPTGTLYYTGPMHSHRPIWLSEQDKVVDAWHSGNPALERPLSLRLEGATPAQAVTQIASATGLNLACFAPDVPGRLSLVVHGMRAWQAMDAVANAWGGNWRRENALYVLTLNETGNGTGAGPAFHRPHILATPGI